MTAIMLFADSTVSISDVPCSVMSGATAGAGEGAALGVPILGNYSLNS